MKRVLGPTVVLAAAAAVLVAGTAAVAANRALPNKKAPTIRIVSPKSGATVSSATVTVSLKVTDPDSAVKKVTIGGVAAKAGRSGSYTAVVRLKVGTNRIAIVATDGKNVSRATLTVKRSAAKPAPAPVGSAFNATYSGQAAVKQSGSAINILVSGVAGSGNLIGNSTLDGQGVGNSNAQPCPTFGGDGSMTAGGDKLTFHVNETSTGCPDDNDQNQITIKGTANVTGGTGKFAKAKGTLSFNGTFDRQKGAMSVTFTGNVSM